ncbi:hypothetical protein H0H93_016840, partial [Arthromyces matolae]
NHCLLPRYSRDGPLGEYPDEELTNFIHHKDAQSQWKWYKPEFDRHAGSSKQPLKARFLCDEDGDAERKKGADYDPEIAPFGSEWVSLKYRESFIADGKEIAPLENDDCDEVDALPDGIEMIQFVGGISVETVAVLLEGEEKRVRGYAGVLPHVEEEHGVGGDSLHHTNEEVSLRIDFEVDEMVVLMVAGREREQVELFLLHDEREAGGEIGETTNDDHEE